MQAYVSASSRRYPIRFCRRGYGGGQLGWLKRI